MLCRALRRVLHVGQTIPEAELHIVAHSKKGYAMQRDVSSSAYFRDKTVVVVGFPGAFTPDCTDTHIPGYIQAAESFREKGATVVGLAVNDPFVLKEFGDELRGNLDFIADAAGVLTRVLDAGVDLTEKGLGFRTRRFSMLVVNGTVTVLNDEGGGQLTELSQAGTMLKALRIS